MESGFSAGWLVMEASAWALLQVRGGLYTLRFEEEELVSEETAVESWVGGRSQATGIAARGKVLSGDGWYALHGDAMLLARQFL